MNYRVLFTDENMTVNVRANNGAHLLCLSRDKLEEIRKDNKKFQRKIQMYENAILRKGSTPLDYMVSSYGKPNDFKEAKERKNLLKNVIMNKIS